MALISLVVAGGVALVCVAATLAVVDSSLSLCLPSSLATSSSSSGADPGECNDQPNCWLDAWRMSSALRSRKNTLATKTTRNVEILENVWSWRRRGMAYDRPCHTHTIRGAVPSWREEDKLLGKSRVSVTFDWIRSGAAVPVTSTSRTLSGPVTPESALSWGLL